MWAACGRSGLWRVRGRTALPMPFTGTITTLNCVRAAQPRCALGPGSSGFSRFRSLFGFEFYMCLRFHATDDSHIDLSVVLRFHSSLQIKGLPHRSIQLMTYVVLFDLRNL